MNYMSVWVVPPSRGIGPPAMIVHAQPVCLYIDSAAVSMVRGSLSIALHWWNVNHSRL